jgi:hypothetical protein
LRRIAPAHPVLPSGALIVLAILAGAWGSSVGAAVSADAEVAPGPAVAKLDFDRTVAPLVAARCLECHSGTEPEGGLNLSARESVLTGGDSGPAVVPGNAGESLLWQRIQDEEMPPEKPLTAAERATLKAWIDRGAAWGSGPIDPFAFTTAARAGYDWWSLQPVVRPEPPRVFDEALVRNPMDRFVLARLQHTQLGFSPEAERRTLIRRLSFDLLGLPPSPEEIETFLTDPAPDAYERLVERMLASPHYGERWARHWLDVVRFGESQGFERDKLRPNAWRYRDWVVRAFNEDLPYDHFVRMQVAGDVLGVSPDGLIATGFLTASPYDEVGQQQQSAAMRAVVRQDELEDLIAVVSQTFLGLTVNCARCHDHKFDPVRQTEYYQLAAALAGVRHGERELEPDGLREENARRAQSLQAQIESLLRRKDRLGAQVAANGGRADGGYGIEQVQFEIEQLQGQRSRSVELKVYAVTPARPDPTHVLIRGNPAQPAGLVAPAGIASIHGVSPDFGLTPDAEDPERRRKLAGWLTDPRQPLVARVIVNRLWHYHFGAGLVETPNDFGFNGGRPSHPELLDWLADELVHREWSLKALHRLIVTSATYRQASLRTESNSIRRERDPAGIDAGNRLLWRKSPQRLDAEAVRDAILSVTGELNSEIGGPGYQDFTTYVRNSQFYEMLDPAGHSFHRRSLYRTWVRSGRNRFLDVFDCPDPSTLTPARAVTTTPLQALALLNNSFVLRMSNAFAARLVRDVGDDVERQVEHAFALAYGRPPDPEETGLATAFIREYGLAAFCRVVFNSNEFLYVD